MAFFGGERILAEDRFVQLISHDNRLYALDSNGQVWQFAMMAGHSRGVWCKVAMERTEDTNGRRF